MKKLFILLLLFPSLTFAAGLILPQGGLGTTTVPTNYVVIGSNALRITAVATSTLFNTANATVNGLMSNLDWSLLHTATTTFSSPLSYSSATNAASCPTCNISNATVSSITAGTGLSGGTITTTGTVSQKSYLATSTADTTGQVSFFSSTNATPATFAGDSTFSFATAGSLLTLKNASTTNLTATYASSTFGTVGTLTLSNALTVSNGGTGAKTLTGCLTGNGTGVITGSGTCNTSAASMTSINFGTGLQGGTITTSGGASLLSYLATSSAETSGQLAAWGSTNGTPAKLYSTATTTLSGTTNQISISNAPVVLGSVGAVISFPSLVILTNASTTGFSAFGTSYFGGTSTSSFDSTGKLTFTHATSTGALTAASGYFTTNASTTALTVSGITNALHLGGATGIVSAYGGSGTCTNQFTRQINGAGVGSCATVGAADVSLANLTATDASLTFSGTYTGATARTIGLNLGNANTWTALQTFNNSTSTLGTLTTGWIGTLNLTNPLTVANGGIGTNTLTGLLQGNGASAFTAITGTVGQFPYFNGTNTVLATSTIVLSTARNVGIQNTSPTFSLTIGDGTADQRIAVESNTQYAFRAQNANGYGFHVGILSGVNGSLVASNDGGTAELTLTSAGALTVASCTGCSSDQRLKKNIKNLPFDSLALLDQLRPVSYNWKGDVMGIKMTTTTQYGFIAQEAQQVFPNLVSKDPTPSKLTPDGSYLLNYQGLFAPIVGAIHELHSMVNGILSRLDGTEKAISIQQQEIDDLKAQVKALQK